LAGAFFFALGRLADFFFAAFFLPFAFVFRFGLGERHFGFGASAIADSIIGSGLAAGCGMLGEAGGNIGSIIPGPLQPLSMGVFTSSIVGLLAGCWRGRGL
jgi:hypothetical protein